MTNGQLHMVKENRHGNDDPYSFTAH